MLLVFWQAPKRRSNQILSMMMLLLASYGILNSISRFLHTIDLNPHLLFSATTLLYVYILGLLYFFSEEFTAHKSQTLRVCAVALIGLYTMGVFADLIFNTPEPSKDDQYGYVFTYKPLGLFFFALGMIFLVTIAVRLRRNPDARTQAVWPAAGVMFFGVMMLLLRPLSAQVGPVLGFVLTFPYNALALGVSALILGRAILEYQLFDPLRELNAELQTANHQLRETSRLKSEFLATMSHELRTPLGGIIGYADLMSQGTYGDVNDVQRERLGRVLRNGQHLLDLINDVLDLSKIEAGQMTLTKREFDVVALVGELLEVVLPQAQERGLTLEFKSNGPVMLYADPLRVRQILMNLLSNAVKFTMNGGVILTLKDGQPDSVCFSVQDTGIGIPAEALDYIFEEFRQVDGSSTRQHGGTGLGLAITKRLVELHNGKLEVQSELGQGSTFRVLLPRQPQDETR